MPVVGAEGASFSNPYIIDDPVRPIYLDMEPGELVVLSATAPADMDMRTSFLRAVRDDTTAFLPTM